MLLPPPLCATAATTASFCCFIDRNERLEAEESDVSTEEQFVRDTENYPKKTAEEEKKGRGSSAAVAAPQYVWSYWG